MAAEQRPELQLLLDARAAAEALAAAVELAVCWGAELRVGLMADEWLERVAALPFATEVLFATGAERRLSPEALAERARRRLERARSQLHRLAGGRVTCRFEERRALLEEALASGRDLFLPPLGPRRLRFPSAHRSSLATVGWLWSGDEGSARALGLLERLVASGATARVRIYALAPLPGRVLARLQDAGARIAWSPTAPEELPRLLRAAADVDLVLLSTSLARRLGSSGLMALLQGAEAPLLVMA
ncbi:MAG: hypothetical protein KatS3mg124_0017 [Porticoccaceae bacterium]|nr:MAG: hypothetical protein KatS3mg124_0017 [Porticoccaceae bacterium]